MTTTANQPAVANGGELTVRRTITIAAPIEKVWAAITEAEHIARWFGQSAVLDEVAVGAAGIFSFEGYGDFPVRIEELDPPRTIAYRWSNDNARAVDPDQVDPLEIGQNAGMVAAHHSQADQARAQVRHDQAPALARVLTAVTMRSRSSWLSDGWTGSDRHSAAALAVSGRSTSTRNGASWWFGIG